MGAPAGTPLPAALPTPGPPATPARGTLAMPVWKRSQRFRLANVKHAVTKAKHGEMVV